MFPCPHLPPFSTQPGEAEVLENRDGASVFLKVPLTDYKGQERGCVIPTALYIAPGPGHSIRAHSLNEQATCSLLSVSQRNKKVVSVLVLHKN